MMERSEGKEKVHAEMTAVILDTLRGLKDDVGRGLKVEISSATVLHGQGSDVDSMALIQLLIDVEKRVGDRYGPVPALTDEKILSQENSPLRTVSSLAEYLTTLVTESKS